MTSDGRIPFCAALIAGGKSTRMGHDKRLIEIEGRPLWLRQIELLQSLQPDELLISGEANGPWKNHPFKVVPDATMDAGPLAGLAATFAASRSPLLLILATDMPRMTDAFLRSLLARCTNACGVVPILNGRFEPLAAVYPRECAALAASQLRSHDFSLQHFVQASLDAGLVKPFEVATDEMELFHNLNSPEDLTPAGRL
ncbi:MAG TPA: molybdenum cofactor guanylyltransferase [Verrucomicrobiota bacterium]|nr:molybdenum cofactor guanylyltransferase [Verrucomicrobiota bacterium]